MSLASQVTSKKKADWMPEMTCWHCFSLESKIAECGDASLGNANGDFLPLPPTTLGFHENILTLKP